MSLLNKGYAAVPGGSDASHFLKTSLKRCKIAFVASHATPITNTGLNVEEAVRLNDISWKAPHQIGRAAAA